ncbi:MAG: hypothetical protein KKB51_08630, partial [Candidatus Riflebacteria bacterium]|nr:hypothetical protein [Candidatus Riflebacteria bacterium]
MKRILLILVTIAVLVSYPVSAAKDPYRDPNAALRYLLAIGYMPSISDDESTTLSEVTDIESLKRIPKELSGKLDEAHSSRFKILLAFAANCTECNFMPDSTFKPEDYIPPYRNLRKFARYLNAGAWKTIFHGNHEDGATLLVATFRFGDDSENYGPLIGYMVGLAIREIAFKSMQNFMTGDFRPAAKKIITDYLKSLPQIAFNAQEGLDWEKKFGEKILQTLYKDDEGLVELWRNLNNESDTAVGNQQPSACVPNQRVLMGALEMATMDGIKIAEYKDFASILEKLVQDKYLYKALVCPDKGKYKVDFVSENDFVVSCSCGADPEAPVAIKDKAAAKEIDPKLLEKARNYKISGKFDKERNE